MYKNSVVNWGHPDSTIFCKQSPPLQKCVWHLQTMQDYKEIAVQDKIIPTFITKIYMST
jgi:hypothetical protein